MLKTCFYLFSLLITGTTILMGAWSTSPDAPASSADSDFVPQALTLGCDHLQGTVNAQQLLKKARECLAPARTKWLRTKIRQTMRDAESKFVAEGFLSRGPNHCARLEMRVKTEKASSRLLVVSDGEVLAEERTIADKEPVLVCDKLPARPEEAPHSAELAREAYLASKGCGGPLFLLQQLAPQLQNLKLRTGSLSGHAVIRLKGEMLAEKMPCFIATAIPLRFCFLYLDAKTLWPHRLEGWGADKTNSLRCVVKIEFHDYAVNQELSLDECMRVFSYEPSGS